MDVIVVPWTPGPLLRLSADDRAGHDLKRRSGVPIDPSDPDIAVLLAAYDAFWAEGPMDNGLIATVHAMMLQAASLLRCKPPAGPAEREYVRRQTNAISECEHTETPFAYLRSAISAGAPPTSRLS